MEADLILALPFLAAVPAVVVGLLIERRRARVLHLAHARDVRRGPLSSIGE